MPGLQPPAIPVFYPGVKSTPQLNVMGQGLAFLRSKVVFRARRVASWTVAENVHQDVPWDTIDEDSHGGWSAGQPTQYVAPAPGWYLVCAQVSLSGTGVAGLVLIPSVAVNGQSQTGQGAAGWEGTELFVPLGTGPKSSIGIWEIYASVGDYIEIDLWYSTESTITAVDVSAGWQPRVEIVWAGV